MDTRTSEITLRLARLRDAMQAQQVHGVLVPSSDPHLSEYLPARWQGREWLSGFTGSMGTLVVTLDRAALFADMRYWTQAEVELAGTGIDLVKIPSGAATHFIDWTAQQLQAGQTLAVDGQCLSLALAQQVRLGLLQAKVKLRTDLDLLDAIWDGRPTLPGAPVYEHAAPQATVSRAAKLAEQIEDPQRGDAAMLKASEIQALLLEAQGQAKVKEQKAAEERAVAQAELIKGLDKQITDLQTKASAIKVQADISAAEGGTPATSTT